MDPLFTAILTIARQLEHDLVHLDIDSIPVHDAVKSYFRYDLTKIKYVTECNAFILYHIVKKTKKLPSQIIIIDHGAGIGLFSFLIKRYGAICLSHDLSKEYLDGIKILGKELKSSPDHFVQGDTDALVSYCTSMNVLPDGLGSRNVIEHLPDYRQFFEQLNVISRNHFIAVITTSANIHNPMVRYIHYKIHNNYEMVGSKTDMDNPTVNAENCGIKLRSSILKNNFPELSPELILKLAKLNRGFMEQQIIDRTKSFLKTGIFPSPHPEPSNTCDPYTGAWVERLVSSTNYRKAADAFQFKFELITGFYNTHYTSTLKNYLSKVINLILLLNFPWNIHLSPFLAMKLTKFNASE